MQAEWEVGSIKGQKNVTCLQALLGMRFNRVTMTSASTLCGRRLPLQPSPWSQTIHPLPVCSRHLWAAAQCWSSEQLSLSVMKSVVGPLRGRPGIPEALHLTQPQSWVVFTVRSYGDSVPHTGTLGWAVQHGAGTPCSSGRASAAKISFLIFNWHTWVRRLPILHLWPAYQSQCGFFFICSVTGVLFS